MQWSQAQQYDVLQVLLDPLGLERPPDKKRRSCDKLWRDHAIKGQFPGADMTILMKHMPQGKQFPAGKQVTRINHS